MNAVKDKNTYLLTMEAIGYKFDQIIVRILKL